MAPTVAELLTPGSAGSAGRLLAEEVVFHSPVRSYTGRPDVAHLLATIGRCLSGIRTDREYADGRHSVAEFTAQVGDRTMDGVLSQLVECDGRVAEATLLLRPLSSLQQAITRMAELLTADPLPSRRTSG